MIRLSNPQKRFYQLIPIGVGCAIALGAIVATPYSTWINRLVYSSYRLHALGDQAQKAAVPEQPDLSVIKHNPEVDVLRRQLATERDKAADAEQKTEQLNQQLIVEQDRATKAEQEADQLKQQVTEHQDRATNAEQERDEFKGELETERQERESLKLRYGQMAVALGQERDKLFHAERCISQASILLQPDEQGPLNQWLPNKFAEPNQQVSRIAQDPAWQPGGYCHSFISPESVALTSPR